MQRDAQIPLFLWIATALLVHLFGGGGAHEAAEWIEERIELPRFGEGVRSYVKASLDTVEIALLDESAPPPEPVAEPKPEQRIRLGSSGSGPSKKCRQLSALL